MTLTQTERIIAAAKSFRGVCQADFAESPAVDGGPAILRVAARIQDAEAAGHIFEVIGERHKTRCYRLIEDDVERSGGCAPPRGGNRTASTTSLSAIPHSPHCQYLSSREIYGVGNDAKIYGKCAPDCKALAQMMSPRQRERQAA